MAKLTYIVAGLTGLLYVAAISGGVRSRNLAYDFFKPDWKGKTAWRKPGQNSVPGGELGDSVRRGELIFNETPLYAPAYATAKVSCSSCHIAGGIQPYASPVVGVPALFPMYNERAGHVISLEDRIQECFVRSENGRPLPYDSKEMHALVNYIKWLSQPEPNTKSFVGRGLISVPDLKPDPKRGAEIYAAQCAGCHGSDGGGRASLFPPLWGPNSFNDGAGMNNVHKMAAFVQHNMPENRKGVLSVQDSFDVSAFIHAQPRPAFNQAYRHF